MNKIKKKKTLFEHSEEAKKLASHSESGKVCEGQAKGKELEHIAGILEAKTIEVREAVHKVIADNKDISCRLGSLN